MDCLVNIYIFFNTGVLLPYLNDSYDAGVVVLGTWHIMYTFIVGFRRPIAGGS